MGGFYLQALKDIKQGEEILLRYGVNITNSGYFFSYGFVYQPNNNDAVQLQL